MCFYEISAYSGAKPLRLTLENAHTHDAGICALTVATTRENHSWCVHKLFKILYEYVHNNVQMNEYL